ncbi:MAG: hypothetical protein UY18_C0010G0013 [Microgenomates group bacterium GW2011_GWF2_47_9]|nr:MAG: hypothetical protein UY18_C0010G0013 [Microgenomates group bacterium GW2011_GWF2_47_9]
MRVMVGFFLFVGLCIAGLSTYHASIAGILKKIGMVEGDFSLGVVTGEMQKIVNSAKGELKCDLPTRMSGAVRYLLSGDQKQGELAFRMGEDRMRCGAELFYIGKMSEGMYELIKGMGYLKQGYTFVSERALVDRRACDYLPSIDADILVREILTATTGKIHEIIWDEWQAQASLRREVEEVCLSRRMELR